MSSEKSRMEQMREQCKMFHVEHPEVWALFVRFSLEMIERGYSHYSAQSVIERIRWEKDAGSDGTTAFKINNNFTAFYSRAFMRVYPQYEGFFRTRHQVSEDSDAVNLPQLTPRDYDYVRC